MASPGEDLHARALIATVAHHKLARVAHDSDFARIPQLPLFTACKHTPQHDGTALRILFPIPSHTLSINHLSTHLPPTCTCSSRRTEFHILQNLQIKGRKHLEKNLEKKKCLAVLTKQNPSCQWNHSTSPEIFARQGDDWYNAPDHQFPAYQRKCAEVIQYIMRAHCEDMEKASNKWLFTRPHTNFFFLLIWCSKSATYKHATGPHLSWERQKRKWFPQWRSLTWDAKLGLELARFLKHLDTVIVGVGHNDVLIHAQAEAVRRVELALARPQLTKLAAVRQEIEMTNGYS